MKKILKIFSLIIMLVIGIVFGDMTRQTYFTSVTEEAPTSAVIVSKSLKSSKPVKNILGDTLPLGNGGKIEIQLVNDKKMVIISMEDLRYSTKKRKRTRLTVDALSALFSRLTD